MYTNGGEGEELVELNRCTSKFGERPLLMPVKTVALGTSFCLKKAYFMLMADNLPGSHTPYRLTATSQSLHDLLAYVVVPFTFRLLSEYSPRVGGGVDVDRLVDEVWSEVRGDVERYSNVNINYRDLRKTLVSMMRGYAAVVMWLVKYGGFSGDGILVFPERMIVSRPVSDVLAAEELGDFLPVIGVPDVVLVDRSSRRAAVIDWKMAGAGSGNELHYVQLLLYQHILGRLFGDVYAFLVYTTERRGTTKVVSIGRNVNLKEFGVSYDYREVSDRLERARYVAQLLYGLAFCKGMLRVAVGLNKSRGLGIRVFNPERGVGKRNYPCNYCPYKTLCRYRFSRKGELDEEMVRLRRGFNKMYRIAVKKKSEEYKNLIDFGACVDFDQMVFKSPRVVELVKWFGREPRPLSDDVMRYSLGRTTVYVFGGDDPLRGSQQRGVFSPILFGRYEDDEVELRSVGGRSQLTAYVRMVSPVFSVRWLPLYMYYRIRPGDRLFQNVKVCKGEVPMNIELRAIAAVENSLVKMVEKGEDLHRWWSSFIKDLVLTAVDEYG